MDDLRQQNNKIVKKNNIRKYKLINFLTKYKWKILIVLIVLIIFIFPVEIGKLIGNFIHNFFGTIIEHSNGI